MCCGDSDRDREWIPDQSHYTCKKAHQQSLSRRRTSITPRVRVHRFIRRRESADHHNRVNAIEMKVENFRLYLENKCMMEQNNQLRKKLYLLQQEKLALFSMIHQKRSTSPN